MSSHSLNSRSQNLDCTLTLGAAGGSPPQQNPFGYTNPSLTCSTDSDILKPTIVSPYEPPSQISSRNKELRNKETQPTPVPNLNDVQPFLSNPDFVKKPGSELEALLMSQHVRNPCAYTGHIAVLPSYSSEPSASTNSSNLRKLVKHALAQSWKYDPMRCSVKGAFQFGQGRASRPSHGLTKDEFKWATGGKLTAVNRAQSTAQMNCEQVRKHHQWVKPLDEGEETLSIDGIGIDREIDDFYSSNSADFRHIDTGFDEGFSEPSPIATTIVSLPDKPLVEERVSTGENFQDSGISMDEGYAEYYFAHSNFNSAKKIIGQVSNEWPTFEANVAPLRTPMKQGRWLELVGDEKQCAWPGRRQGPYDLHGLHSHDVNQMMVVPSDDNTYKSPWPAQVPPLRETAQPAQVVSELVQGEVNSEVAGAGPQSFSYEKSLCFRDNNTSPIIYTAAEHDEAPVDAAHSANEERSQLLSSSIEHCSDDGFPTTNVIHKAGRINIDANAHACRSIHSTALSTPVDHRVHQIEAVHLDTPATVNINLTPELKKGMNTPDAFDPSHEIHLPSSPTTNTQKGKGALGCYVKETASHPSFPCQNSSILSFDGSEVEYVSLKFTPEHPRQLGDLAGFSEAVQSYQKKSDAVFTLSPPKHPETIMSPSKVALVPVTPANRNGSAQFRPMTPFQLDKPARAEPNSPGTPTPAPRSKSSRAKQKSVRNVFRSSKLGNRRSPEHGGGGETHSDFVFANNMTPAVSTGAASANPATGRITQFPATNASSSGGGGSAGLLFQTSKKKERGTMNVLNSLKLMSPEQQRRGQGIGVAEPQQTLDDVDHDDEYEDELAGGTAGGAEARGTGLRESTPTIVRSGAECGARAGGSSSGKKMVQTAVGGLPRVRARDEGVQRSEANQAERPPKKKQRRSERIGASE